MPCLCTIQPLKSGHLTNQDTFFCPKGVRIREVPTVLPFWSMATWNTWIQNKWNVWREIRCLRVTYRQRHMCTQITYCNPCCACAARVNKNYTNDMCGWGCRSRAVSTSSARLRKSQNLRQSMSFPHDLSGYSRNHFPKISRIVSVWSAFSRLFTTAPVASFRR